MMISRWTTRSNHHYVSILLFLQAFEGEKNAIKWWDKPLSELKDQSTKWSRLEHNGPTLPPPYEPHGVHLKYDGKTMTLSAGAEEIATYFAVVLESANATNPIFIKNFFRGWKKKMTDEERQIITDFEKCDFKYSV